MTTGLFNQINETYAREYKWSNAREKTFVVSDVGDYSLFINKNLKDVQYFRIKTKHSSWYEPTQIISTEAGSILYFNECIKDVFKRGCIYPANVVMEFRRTYRRFTVQDLTRALKKLYKPKHPKRRRKCKPLFRPAYIQDWEWEIETKTK